MKVRSFFQRLRDAPISRKLYFTVGIMAFLIALELAALFFSVRTLSSVRAYVGGEGLWSKAQKDAMYQLLKYGRTHDEIDYIRFTEYMRVPLGDHKSLMELKKEMPDRNEARQGFVQGRNHPEDVEGMINLFSWFNKVVYIHKAIAIWEEADPLVARFIPISERLHEEINSPNPSQEKISRILLEIDPLNARLTALEDDFSYTLGEGSRWLEHKVLQLLFAIALTVECTGLLLVIGVNRGIQKGLKELLISAQSVARGDFKAKAKIFSRDEIGQLAVKFNHMSEALEKSAYTISQEKRKFMVLLESAPDAMLIINNDGIIQQLNAQCESIFGYQADELIGKKAEVLLPEHLRQKHPDLHNLLFASPSKKTMLMGLELQGQRKNGEVFPAEISLSSLQTDEGLLACVSVRDISDRKYMKELERKNTDLEQYAYVASHDLREPLNTILSTVSLMQEEYRYSLNKEGHDYLTFIKESSKRMNALISGLLEYSKLGKEIRYEPTDCTEIMDQVTADMKAHIDAEQADIQYGRLPVVYGNKIQLRLLFQNLVGNAIKFHKKEQTPHVKIAATEDTAYYHFTVQDDGIGMDNKHLTEIFTIFKRLNGRTHYEGTGIGLAHCKKIVELHNGQIWVESTPGKGSTFHFTLLKKENYVE